jgi:hypothetical protein
VRVTPAYYSERCSGLTCDIIEPVRVRVWALLALAGCHGRGVFPLDAAATDGAAPTAAEADPPPPDAAAPDFASDCGP